jgi:hypothetical protein
MQSIPYISSVVVSTDSIESDDPYDVVYANITFVNALFEDALLRDAEVSRDALRSYYVDYYLAQVHNGGFAQFVWNTRWADDVVTLVREGLAAMGAAQHLALFDEGSRLVASLGDERLADFFDDDYFGDDNPERDELNTLADRFVDIPEDLVALNAAWLRGLDNLTVLDGKQMRAEVERIAAAVPDRADRIALAQANEPPYLKIIRALCERTGHTLDRVTAGDPTHVHAGQPALAWHFLTDRGHFYMVETADGALMYGDDGPEPVAQLPAAIVAELSE